MISLTISGTTPITIPDTLALGTAGIVLMEIRPGRSVADNLTADSSFVDGAALIASRRDLTTLEIVVRVQGSTMDNLISRVADLAAAVDQFGYTVTQTGTVGTVVWTCLPASWERAYNKDLMLHNADLVTLSIPRQP